MNLTLFDLDNLDKQCKNMSQLIKEIKNQTNSENDNRKLFVSRADYEESLLQEKKIPQDFYFFRDFDVFIQLVYNKRTKKYQIYCENYYSIKLNSFERSPQSDKSYIISSKFDESYKFYHDIILCYITDKINKDYGLF